MQMSVTQQETGCQPCRRKLSEIPVDDWTDRQYASNTSGRYCSQSICLSTYARRKRKSVEPRYWTISVWVVNGGTFLVDAYRIPGLAQNVVLKCSLGLNG